ncbi:NAD(P)(+) transhydrogenase (Re/Si-specific) subunit alpha, partial [Rhizobium sp. CNPSo 3464]|nr:NAD(P)(+) transhydrogenase (Re/Si-specific) subunit alpha [Rhizobium sp. CNPSo 3464]
MKFGSPRETAPGELRVALTPEAALQLQKLGYECVIETGAGKAAGFSDEAYRGVGVTVVDSAALLYETSDVIAKVRPPEAAEVDRLAPGKTLISFFYPAQNKDLLDQARSSGATVIAMDMVPRISRAQKMDALSSMAN